MWKGLNVKHLTAAAGWPGAGGGGGAPGAAGADDVSAAGAVELWPPVADDEDEAVTLSNPAPCMDVSYNIGGKLLQKQTLAIFIILIQPGYSNSNYTQVAVMKSFLCAICMIDVTLNLLCIHIIWLQKKNR